MGSTKLNGILLLAVGAALLYFGYNATQSTVESIGETLTGKYSDEKMIYLIGGGAAAVAGLFLLLRKN